MTREEAIEVLQQDIPCEHDTDLIEALEMAIAALKQEPCEDAISRQAVLDLPRIKTHNQWGNVIKESVDIEDVRQLSPVTPAEKVGKWIPVSERLPEDKQSVLVWCPQYKNIYCAYLEKEQWWIFGAFVQIVPNEVVAWCELPEPYKASPTGAEGSE